jgi:hypothetical protein
MELPARVVESEVTSIQPSLRHIARISIGVLAWASVAQAQCRSNASATFFDLSTAELQRKVVVFTAIGTAVNRFADVAIDHLVCDRQSGSGRNERVRGVAIRLARLYFVNLPIAALTEGVGVHGAGHFVQAHQNGLTGEGRHVDRWPWPLPVVKVREFVGITRELPVDDVTTVLSLVAGGEEGASVLEDNTLERLYGSHKTNYFDWVLLAYAKLDSATYALVDLRPRYFSSFPAFDNPSDRPGDFRQFAVQFAALKMTSQGADGASIEDTRKIGDKLRKNALLQLADFGLWASVFRVATYVAGAEGSTPPAISIGPVRFVPKFYAALRPVGIERGISSIILLKEAVTSIRIGTIETPSGGSLPTYGMTVTRPNAAFQARVSGDVWKDSVSGRFRFRLETGIDRPVRPRRVTWNGSVSYKTTGHLQGWPFRDGFSAAAGVGVVF